MLERHRLSLKTTENEYIGAKLAKELRLTGGCDDEEDITRGKWSFWLNAHDDIYLPLVSSNQLLPVFLH